MDKVVNILILEDNPTDVILVKRVVSRAYPAAMFTVSRNEAEFTDRLGWGSYDVILSDYNLPGYNGLEALLLVKEKYSSIPFIFVTGMLNSEEKSAQAILTGASGYVIKDNLAILPAQIKRALTISAKANAAKDEQREKARIHKLKLQKIHALLQNSEDFAEKEQLLTLLQELRSDQN